MSVMTSAKSSALVTLPSTLTFMVVVPIGLPSESRPSLAKSAASSAALIAFSASAKALSDSINANNVFDRNYAFE